MAEFLSSKVSGLMAKIKKPHPAWVRLEAISKPVNRSLPYAGITQVRL